MPSHRFALVTALLLTPAPAQAQVGAREKLGFFAGAGYLGSPDLGGAAFVLGVRYRPVSHLALGFDAGYGVIGTIPTVEDRWWLMPSVALVVPMSRVAIDVGAGLGVGASSGYATWNDYVAAPFGPVWALQLVPALRGHVMSTIRLTKRLDLFVRVDVASLLVSGDAIGSRVGNPNPSGEDTLWIDLLMGIHFRVL